MVLRVTEVLVKKRQLHKDSGEFGSTAVGRQAGSLQRLCRSRQGKGFVSRWPRNYSFIVIFNVTVFVHVVIFPLESFSFGFPLHDHSLCPQFLFLKWLETPNLTLNPRYYLGRCHQTYWVIGISHQFLIDVVFIYLWYICIICWVSILWIYIHILLSYRLLFCVINY